MREGDLMRHGKLTARDCGWAFCFGSLLDICEELEREA